LRAPDDRGGALAEAISELCRRHVTPDYVRRCDDEQRYPEEAMRHLAAAGWAELATATGPGRVRDLAVAHMVLARHSLAVAQAFYSLWVLGGDMIAREGTQAQRQEWLPQIAAGEARIAFALTEPGSGSDAAALKTVAREDGGDFVVNGQKVFTTGAAVADAIIVVARTDPVPDRHAGLSMLLLDPRLPGVRLNKLSKLGLRPLDLCEVFLGDVRVPASAVLGRRGDAWTALDGGLALERALLAAICVGALEEVLEVASAHARERHAFGRPIGSFQLVSAKLADIKVALEASRLLTLNAADAADREDPQAAVLAAMAKLHASEGYVEGARQALQVLGGYGFTEDYPLARHYRDSKFMEIGGGTSEIQRVIIARSLGLGSEGSRS
jgi:alkylation response protein AidB-like acyl-CoA dehydrogenase